MKLETDEGSGGNSKSPKKMKTEISTSTHNAKDDGDIDNSGSDKFQSSGRPSVEERCNESEEEENGENEHTSQKQPKEISKVQFSQNNSSQEKFSVKSTFSTEDITSDDEVYTMQYPQNFDKHDLCGKNIEIRKLKTALTSKGEVFQIQLLNSNKKFITLAVPKNALGGSLVKLPFKGHIVIQKSVDVSGVEPMDEDPCDKNKVSFPTDIKVRHPLLGCDWKSHVELANSALVKFESPRKKRKKIKKEKFLDENVGTKRLKQESSESEAASPKKKRIKQESSESETASPKKKRIKCDL